MLSISSLNCKDLEDTLLFTAILDGQKIDLLQQKDQSQRFAISKAIKNVKSLLCSFCKEPMIFRNGEKNATHFAHKDRQAKFCQYLSFGSSFLTKAENLTKAFADYIDATYPGAECETEEYYQKHETFFFLQTKFVDGNQLVFRFRRRDMTEKEWHEVPAGTIIPGARTVCVIIGHPKTVIPPDAYRKLVDSNSDEIPQFIYFSNKQLHIKDWNTQNIIAAPLERIGILPDGQVFLTPDPAAKIPVYASIKSNPIYAMPNPAAIKPEKPKATWLETEKSRSMSALDMLITEKRKMRISAAAPVQIAIDPETPVHETKDAYSETVRMRCGHEQTVTVFCCKSELSEKLMQAYNAECRQCSMKSTVGSGQAILEQLKSGIPNLIGSDKQIKWANGIRSYVGKQVSVDSGVTNHVELITFVMELLDTCLQVERLRWYLAYSHILVEKGYASWWITNKEDPVSAYLKETGQAQARLW